MTVTIDAFSAGGSGVNLTAFNTTLFANTTSNMANFANVGGSATFLLVGLIYAGNPATSGAVALTWDSGGTAQAMTALGSVVFNTNTGFSMQYFGLVSPTPGNKVLTVTNSGNSSGNQNMVVWGMSFNGSVTTSVAAATEGYASNTDGGSSGTSLSASSSSSVAAGDLAVTQWHDTAGVTGFPSDGGTLGDNIFTGVYAYEYYSGSGAIINSTATSAPTNSFWTGMIVGIKSPPIVPAGTPFGVIGMASSEW